MKKINILHVEDNEGDIVLIQEAFLDSNLEVNLINVRDGRQAIEYLNNAAHINSFITPDLILLDINLPKLNGHQVLAYCKNSELKEIPIVMLTTSSSSNDILEAYKGYVNCYITKPLELSEYLSTIKAIEEFWFNFAQLPITLA